MFDHELVLPEYIVYFEYTTGVIGVFQVLLLLNMNLLGNSHTVNLLSQDRERPALQSRDDAPSNDIILDKEVLNMEPVLRPQPKLLSLDDKILLHVARANVLSQITVSLLTPDVTREAFLSSSR